jgi:hypothetical protein
LKRRALIGASLAIAASVATGENPAAHAQSGSDALKSFGILGAWSDDCAKPRSPRILVTTTKMVVTWNKPTNKDELQEFTIVSAQLATREKLLIKTTNVDKVANEEMFVKAGQKIKMEDGTMLEKCLN